MGLSSRSPSRVDRRLNSRLGVARRSLLDGDCRDGELFAQLEANEDEACMVEELVPDLAGVSQR